MPDGEVVSLNDQFWAKCEVCNGIEFSLMIDGPGSDWQNIIGTVCIKCKNKVEWIKVMK